MQEKIFCRFFKKFDNFFNMRYNSSMKTWKTIIIGAGASGLTLAVALLKNKQNVLILDRNDRVGKKLSATGNGQGNVTNLGALRAEYFSATPHAEKYITDVLQRHTDTDLRAFWEELGVLTVADERGRVYPASRQASALTDALRFYLQEQGAQLELKTTVTSIQKSKGGFCVTATTENGEVTYFAENVALCAGGKAAKNFGTDGTAYALVKDLGHTVTPLYPSLVQLKTDTEWIKTLKGIRIHDGILRLWQGKRLLAEEKGDIIFTDYGISGDAVFRISAFAADKITADLRVTIDALPDFAEEKILQLLLQKQQRFPHLPIVELLCGVLNNQVGRAILKRADGDLKRAAALVKAFPLSIKGSLGFDYAQVTKGGIPLTEVDEALQSKKVQGLYFAGEILDVDGQCGGYNLQWAYSSACVVAESICKKGRGQVCE